MHDEIRGMSRTREESTETKTSDTSALFTRWFGRGERDAQGSEDETFSPMHPMVFVDEKQNLRVIEEEEVDDLGDNPSQVLKSGAESLDPENTVYATVRDMSRLLLSGAFGNQRSAKNRRKLSVERIDLVSLKGFSESETKDPHQSIVPSERQLSYSNLSEHNNDNYDLSDVIRKDSGYLSRRKTTSTRNGMASTDILPLDESLLEIKKKALIAELLETEQKYVEDLKNLVENCFDRLNAVSWLPLDQKCLLIRNANELLRFQQEFLGLMENVITPEALNKQRVDIPIGQVFIEMERKFDVYTQYCTQHDGALKILSQLEKKPEMMSVLADFRGKNQTRLDVRDFLIKPVQRICRYPLLLAELIKLSDDTSPNLPSLLQAHSVMQDVAADIDSAKWYLDNLQRTDRFFTRLEIPETVGCPTRSETGEIVLGNVLLVHYWDKGSPRFIYMGVFLFSNHVFLVKIKKSHYQLKFCLSLENYTYSESDIIEHGWSLTQKTEAQRFVFGASSQKERKVWLNALKIVMCNSCSCNGVEIPVRASCERSRRASIGSPSGVSPPMALPLVEGHEARFLKRNSSTGSINMLRRASIDIRNSLDGLQSATALVGHNETSEPRLFKEPDMIHGTVRTEEDFERHTPFSRRSMYDTRKSSFWRQSDYTLTERSTTPNIRKGSVDARVADVITPNIERLEFVTVAGLIVPKCAKRAFLSSSPSFPLIQMFAPLDSDDGKRCMERRKKSSKIISWSRQEELVKPEGNCATIMSQRPSTPTGRPPSLRIETTVTQTTDSPRSIIEHAAFNKELPRKPQSELAKPEKGLASSIRKSFQFLRTSTDTLREHAKHQGRFRVKAVTRTLSQMFGKKTKAT